MRRKLLLSALTALAQTACTAAALVAASAAVPVGESFTLAVGESAAIDGEDLRLTFDGVTRDNRCPRDVQCIVAGAATVVLTAESGGEKRELTLDVPPGGSAAVGYDGLEITVAKVEPEAHSQRRIEPADYVVTLVVERSEDGRGSPSPNDAES